MTEKNIFIDEYRSSPSISFIMNALDDGWSVKKRNNAYIFRKKHGGKKEIFSDNYLEKFIEHNFRRTPPLPTNS